MVVSVGQSVMVTDRVLQLRLSVYDSSINVYINISDFNATLSLSRTQSDHTVAKDFRKNVRVLMARLHKKKGPSGSETTALAALTPEVQGFIQKLAEDWHTMLAKKRPRVVAKRVRKEKRTLPSGLEKDHFRWLCRFMARWHRRHAGKCDIMSGWSSGETGGETSGEEEEEAGRGQEKKQKRRGKNGATTDEAGGAVAENTEEKVS